MCLHVVLSDGLEYRGLGIDLIQDRESIREGDTLEGVNLEHQGLDLSSVRHEGLEVLGVEVGVRASLLHKKEEFEEVKHYLNPRMSSGIFKRHFKHHDLSLSHLLERFTVPRNCISKILLYI